MYDHRLKTLLVLLETKNYTKTAEKLYITQPAVTHHIKSLEKDTNIKIFDNPKLFLLSPKGKILHDYALKAIRLNEQLILALSNYSSEKKGFKIALTNQVMASYIKRAIKYLFIENVFDNASFKVKIMRDILSDVKNGNADYGIVDCSFDTNDFISKLLMRTNIVLIVGQKHPLWHKIKINVDQLFEETIFVDNNGSGIRSRLRQEMNKNNIYTSSFKNLIEMNDVDTIIESVKEGIGLGFVYQTAITNELRNGEVKIIDINDFDMIQSFYLIASKDNLAPKEAGRIALKIVNAYREAVNED